jgi:hypothetical protein
MGVMRGFVVAGLEEAARYLGCVGKVANGITTVHLAYVRERTGHALIGARGWIPAEQIDDPVTSLVIGLPEVYGACTELREFCEERGQRCVLRVPSTFRLTWSRAGSSRR